MTTTLLAQAVPWGDRTELLPKRMSYVASLDVVATTAGHYLKVAKAANAAPCLRHLFGDTIVTMPEGLRCDLPVASVIGGDGEIGTPSSPESGYLRLRVSTKIEQNVVLDIGALGVINLDGGSGVLLNRRAKTVSGRAFVATRNEVVSPTYRWLYRRQLFGVGSVVGERIPSREWRLTFSFDFYAAA